jgi:DNA polymerase III subunit epsilon
MAARQIVLDTETTGLNARLGDRVIEIGCVELLSRRITDRTFHAFVNPEREIEAGAAQVHGIDREFLADKPKFAAIAAQFLDYVRGAELVIHNAEFDVEFLDRELALAGFGKLSEYVSGIVDSLAMARDLHPAKRNSLDALCERYTIDNSHRTVHGALLDARLLAEVYLAMTRGQESLVMELETPAAIAMASVGIDLSLLIVLRASPEEAAAHERYLDALEKETSAGALWRRLAAA